MAVKSMPRPYSLCRHFGENSNRYFRFLSALWKYSKVVGLRTMAERKRRDGRKKNAHRPAMMRSAARSLGARFRLRFKISSSCRTSTHSAITPRNPPGFASLITVTNQMNEQDDEFTHCGDGIKSSSPDLVLFCNSAWTGGTTGGPEVSSR